MQNLSPQAILRVAVSLIAAARAMHGAGHAWDDRMWDDTTAFGENGLGLDSLLLWTCSSEVSRFFRLYTTGPENRLLQSDTLGGWCRMIEAALKRPEAELSFETSGTTGLPKFCRHHLDDLVAEARFWHQRLAGCSRVVQTVPAHHIYGFLFTILLPELAGWPVLDARMADASALRHNLRPNDLLVGFPAQLSLFLRANGEIPHGLHIVSATSRLDEEVHSHLYALGATTVIDIYGSSETGGIAERSEPGSPFTLLPRWRRAASGGGLTDIGTGADVALPDHVAWENERRLRPAARVDGAVQVAGVNVYPARVAAILLQHEMVADCSVWLDSALLEPRLCAFLVPRAPCDAAEFRASVDRWSRRRLTALEQPMRYAVGAALA